MKKYFLLPASLLVLSLVFLSCSKNETANSSQSTLNVRLTDAPTNFNEVNIDIREVRVKFTDDANPDDGWFTLNTIPGIYNLLEFQNGVDTLIATGVFPVQVVKEIRFITGPDNSIVDGGVLYPLTIPSGAESGLKLKINRPMHETLETIVLDFDAALSIHQEGNGVYKLRPVIRILP